MRRTFGIGQLATGLSLGLLAGVTAFGQPQVQTIAGGYLPNHVPAISAGIGVGALAVEPSGTCYIAGDGAVYRMDSAGQLTRVAGIGSSATFGDGGPALNAGLGYPIALALDKGGLILYIADLYANRVRRVDLVSGVITTVAGTGVQGFGGDGGPAAKASLNRPTAIAVDPAGNLIIADTENNRLRRVDPITGTISTIAGNGTAGHGGDHGPAISAQLVPVGVAVDASGNIYIADGSTVNSFRTNPNGSIRLVSGGVITTFNNATDPLAVAVDPAGRVYVLNESLTETAFTSFAVSRIDSLGATIVAGGATAGSSFADGIPATQAALFDPFSIGVDAAGNLFIAELGVIRRVDAATKLIRTVTGGNRPSTEGAPATSATFRVANGLALDGRTLYLCGNVLQTVDLSSNILRTPRIAGFEVVCSTLALDGMGAVYFGAPIPGVERFSLLDGSDGAVPGTSTIPVLDVTVDRSGALWIADGSIYAGVGGNRVWRLPSGSATPIVVAGNGRPGFAGDGAVATSASVSLPSGIALDASGNLFIADTGNHSIRRLELNSGVIMTLVGNGTPAYTVDGPAAKNALVSPQRLAADATGNLYFSDKTNRFRRISMVAAPRLTVSTNSLSFTAQPGATPPAPQSVAIGSSGAVVSFTISANAAWLAVSQATGQTGGSITVSVTPAGLIAGDYTGTVTVASTGTINSALVSVSLHLAPPPKNSLTLDPQSMSFSLNAGDPAPDPQTLSIRTTRDGVSFSAAAAVDTDVQWLQIDTVSGSTRANIQVSVVNLDMLDPGVYNGTITVTAPDADPVSQSVAVQLQIIDPSATPVSGARIRSRHQTVNRH